MLRQCAKCLLRGHRVACVSGERLRGLSSAADEQIIVPMPKLSHEMSSGMITKWLKSEGDDVKAYELVFEIATDELTEDAYKVGDFAGKVTLTVEAQEDFYLAKILEKEGATVTVGKPVGIAYDTKDAAERHKDHTPKVQDVYNMGSNPVQVLMWQCYLKSSSKSGEGGCM